MSDERKINIIPGPSPIYGLDQVSLEESTLSFSEMIELYKKLFKQKGHIIEYKIGSQPTLTQHRFTTNIEIEIPKERNSGHTLNLDMILNVIVNKGYLVSQCEMSMDEEYYNLNKNSLLNFLFGLNDDLNKLGINHYVRDDDFGPVLGWEQVWENLLTEESFSIYYFHILNNFEQFSHNFDHLNKFLYKLRLGDDQYVFPQFL